MIVLEKLMEHMATPQAEEEFKDFTAVEDAVVKETSETLKDIDRDIAATKALIERLEKQAELGLLTDEDLQKKANESYKAAKAELERLDAKSKETTLIALEDEERRTYKQLMQEVGEAWEEIIMPEEFPRLVYLFITSVTLEQLSPLFFLLHLQWRDPTWGIDCGLCYKGGQSGVEWSAEEVTILSQHFETTPRSKLMELLPRRGYQAMKSYVKDHQLGINRHVPPEPHAPHLVCLEDWKIMQEHGILEEELRSERSVKIITWAIRHFTRFLQLRR